MYTYKKKCQSSKVVASMKKAKVTKPIAQSDRRRLLAMLRTALSSPRGEWVAVWELRYLFFLGHDRVSELV